jgi:hypothetical protein
MNEEKFKMIFLKTHPYYAYSTYELWDFETRKDSLLFNQIISGKKLFINTKQVNDTSAIQLNDLNFKDKKSKLLHLEFEAKMNADINESVLVILLKDGERYIDLHHFLLKRKVKVKNQAQSLIYEIPIHTPINHLKIDLLLESIDEKSETEINFRSVKIYQLID